MAQDVASGGQRFAGEWRDSIHGRCRSDQMGVANSPGPDRPYPARRSIRFRFAAIVALPVVCLVVLWGVAVALSPAGTVVRHGLFSRSHPGLTDVAIFAGGALIVVLLAVILMGWFARRVSRDL